MVCDRRPPTGKRILLLVPAFGNLFVAHHRLKLPVLEARSGMLASIEDKVAIGG